MAYDKIKEQTRSEKYFSRRKTMKKLLTILLILCMLLSSLALFSCDEDNGDDDEEEDESSFVKSELKGTAGTLSNAMNATVALTGVDATITINASSTPMPGVSIQIPATLNLKANATDIYMNASANVMDESYNAEVYTDGEWVYVYAEGEGYKFPYEADTSDVTIPESFDDIVKEIPEEIINDITVEKDGREASLTFIVTESKYSYVHDTIKEAIVEADLAYDEDDIDISDININLVLAKDGYIKSLTLDFSIDGIVVEGMELPIDAEIKIEINEVGKAVEVTPIPDCEDFEEYYY
jgi:hypothetical protein